MPKKAKVIKSMRRQTVVYWAPAQPDWQNKPQFAGAVEIDARRVERSEEVKTADQFELVILLYKGAAKHLNLAKKFLREGDIENRVGSINKAAAMIGELQAALDYEKGGEIAASLNQLYSYMLNRLASANYDQKTEPLDEVLQLLGTLQSAWAQARVEYNQLPAPSQFNGQPQGTAPATPAAVR